jgi:hypothetical protein
VRARFATAIEWGTIGLPSDYFPLIAGHRKAFVPKEQCIVAHGGISIEELIVPLVEIGRKVT